MSRGPVTSDTYSRDIRYEPPKAISTSVHLTETDGEDRVSILKLN